MARVSAAARLKNAQAAFDVADVEYRTAKDSARVEASRIIAARIKPAREIIGSDWNRLSWPQRAERLRAIGHDDLASICEQAKVDFDAMIEEFEHSEIAMRYRTAKAELADAKEARQAAKGRSRDAHERHQLRTAGIDPSNMTADDMDWVEHGLPAIQDAQGKRR